MKVCVLVISLDRYGDDVYVCADSDAAMRRLEEYVDEWWDESMVVRRPGCEDAIPEKPEDMDEKIEQYFETMGDREGHETFPDEEVIGTKTKHTSMYGAILGVIASLRERAENIEYTCTGDMWDGMELIEKMAREGLDEVWAD